MEKIKHFLQSEIGKDIMIIFIILLVGVSSFFLGRSSKTTPNSDLLIKYSQSPNIEAQALKSLEKGSKTSISDTEDKYVYEGVDLTNRNYFASKRGKKYYPFGCSAGKSIKEENRIYFDGEEEAKSKGYTLSSSCD